MRCWAIDAGARRSGERHPVHQGIVRHSRNTGTCRDVKQLIYLALHHELLEKDCQEQVDKKEAADDYDDGEVDDDKRGASARESIHIFVPGVEGERFEHGGQAVRYVIEACGDLQLLIKVGACANSTTCMRHVWLAVNVSIVSTAIVQCPVEHMHAGDCRNGDQKRTQGSNLTELR
eukprot:5283011-Prymnesium_polylepis.1